MFSEENFLRFALIVMRKKNPYSRDEPTSLIKLKQESLSQTLVPKKGRHLLYKFFSGFFFNM